MLEEILENPLDWKEIQAVYPKGDHSWVFIGGTDVEDEIPIVWPPDAERWLIGKESDAGRDGGRTRRGRQRMRWFGWHHWHTGHGLGWTLGVGDGQGGLACCGSVIAKSQTRLSDWTELNWNVDYDFSFFTSGFIDLVPLPLFLDECGWRLISFIVSKNQFSESLIFSKFFSLYLFLLWFLCFCF